MRLVLRPLGTASKNPANTSKQITFVCYKTVARSAQPQQASCCGVPISTIAHAMSAQKFVNAARALAKRSTLRIRSRSIVQMSVEGVRRAVVRWPDQPGKRHKNTSQRCGSVTSYLGSAGDWKLNGISMIRCNVTLLCSAKPRSPILSDS